MPISQKSLDFLFKNWATNSREWFLEHKGEYTRLVVEPLAELVTKLTPGMLEIDPQLITEPKIDKTISRIYRDMRIPQNRSGSRYRQNCWILFIRDKKLYNGLPAFYFEMDPASFSYGMGYYQAATDSIRTIKDMILNGEPAAKKALRAYDSQSSFVITGAEYKRLKYPDAPENLRPWLERRDFSFIRECDDFDLLFSKNLADVILEDFKKIAPVYDFFMAAEARRIRDS